jgi:aspartate racemase
MKIAGLIGGIGPESTIEYYRQIIARYRERVHDGSYPHFVVDSIDLKKMVDLISAGRLPEVTEYLLSGLQSLERAGAHFAAVAANTPHVVFDALRPRSPLPLLSIVEATCSAARAQGLRRVGLFGTRFTMQGRFYPDVFTQAGVELVVPVASDQDYIHDKYMTELIEGVLLPETRAGLLEVVARLRQQEDIEGLILGGTELPLILGDAQEAGIPLLDTTRIHVEAIVARMLG